MSEVQHYQVAVLGASLGGVLSAYQSAKQGMRTVLVSQFDWIGGQLTAQGVPVDEHRYIESFGATQSYYAFRGAMRAHYREQPDFVDNSAMTEGMNPGDGWVSRLCVEPKVAHQYLRELLRPYIEAGTLVLIEKGSLSAVKREQRRISQVQISTVDKQLWLSADYYLDASDTGELLAQANMNYRLGKESKAEFGEPDAPAKASRADQQPVTYVMALKKSADNSELVTRPELYNFWREHQLPKYNYPIFGEYIPGSEPFSKVHLPLFGEGETLDLWRYRRIVASHNWHSERASVTLFNCAQNDYALEPYLDNERLTEQQISANAKELSLCFVYWLQNDAPRSSINESGYGFKNISLATDVLGTEDGFAQQVYVRESRRIIGLETLTQNDIAVRFENDNEPAQCANSVGIGLYNMDIHPTCESQSGCDTKVRPFELPLGIFIAQEVDNVLPACKNISVTHLVNAATRVHPIEWLIGEVAANIATYCIKTNSSPNELYHSQTQVTELQTQLQESGIPLHWPDSLQVSKNTKEQ